MWGLNATSVSLRSVEVDLKCSPESRPKKTQCHQLLSLFCLKCLYWFFVYFVFVSVLKHTWLFNSNEKKKWKLQRKKAPQGFSSEKGIHMRAKRSWFYLWSFTPTNHNMVLQSRLHHLWNQDVTGEHRRQYNAKTLSGRDWNVTK